MEKVEKEAQGIHVVENTVRAPQQVRLRKPTEDEIPRAQNTISKFTSRPRTYQQRKYLLELFGYLGSR